MAILVTGVAGFIGMHLVHRLLEQGRDVVGVDNLSSYYDVNLKEDRLAVLSSHTNFRFIRLDLAEDDTVDSLFNENKITEVVHLAAQPGVRYSVDHPHAYIKSNINGFANVIENCRRHHVSHLVYASSSSVYGASLQMPFSEHHEVAHPLSLYAATKRSDELLAHAYSHVYGLPTTGLRLFTVYGPWARPDMAPMLFARAIHKGQPIHVFNNGKMLRDFTYIEDVVESIIRIIPRPAAPNPSFDASHPDPASSPAPYRIYNVASQHPVTLMEFIQTLEDALGKTTEKIMLPLQPGDMVATYADTQELARTIHWTSTTPLRTGLARFVEWFNSYHDS